jgi:hypothetical protein
MNEDPPKWLEKIAYEAAKFSAVQYEYAESENGLVDKENVKDRAEEYYDGILITFSKIYYDALRCDKELAGEKG